MELLLFSEMVKIRWEIDNWEIIQEFSHAHVVLDAYETSKCRCQEENLL